ncbi:DUF7521 family protein [Haloprofundus halophilus]|uniref:DUF7521 family protein n=1 Tax=Haloprofundus halophilus TaxID=2283527 RepID=UPI000E42F80D|nr:hypothetical protein [Haloprofundus halophilus]
MQSELLVAKAIVVVLGLLIAVQGFRASRREQSRRMLFVAGGFALLSVGSVLESVCYDVFELSVFLSGLVQSSVLASGMLLILVSLFVPAAAGRPAESR